MTINVFKLTFESIKALPVAGSQVEDAEAYGHSLWGRTAKITCRTPDGNTAAYFHKVRQMSLT